VVKKWMGLGAAFLAAGACATLAPPISPTLHIENPSSSIAAGFSLDARIAVEEAWNLLRSRKTDRAEKMILRFGEAHPFYEAGLGYVALLRDDLAGAEIRFQRSIEAHPELTTARLGLGQVHQKMGMPEEALKSYLEVLKREPEHAFAGREADSLRATIVDALLSEAGAAVQAGQTAEAKEAYLKVLEYAPSLQAAHLSLARIFVKEKDFPSALFHLRTATANDPNDVAALRDYADLLYQTEQFSRSLDAYHLVLRIDPGDRAAKDRAEALKNKLGVIELPEAYREIPNLEAVTKEAVAALIGAKFDDVRSGTAARTAVIVDISTSWARTFIVKVASFGLMEVYPNHTFQPRKTLTRAEMAETVAHLVDFLKKKGRPIVAQIPEERIRISDVPPEHAYARPIIQAVSYQLMDLFPDRTFRPEQPVPGTEAVRILDLLAGLAK